MINLFSKIEHDKLLVHGGKLLDLGCGDGSLSLSFHKCGYSVKLFDQDIELLRMARESFSLSKSAPASTISGDVNDFKFVDTYSGIIISKVLHYVHDKKCVARIVNDAYGALTSGGFLYFNFLGPKDEWAKSMFKSL